MHIRSFSLEDSFFQNWRICAGRLTKQQRRLVPRSASVVGGFTLIELMVAVAVMLVLTTVFAFQFRAFDSTTILRARTSEAAQTIRIAQGYATTIRGVTGGAESRFAYPYGVSFSQDSNEIAIFYYRGDQALARNDENDNDSRIIDLRTLGVSHGVVDLCVEFTNGTEECNLERLDISFVRPETRAYFYPVAATGPLGETNIAFARIKIQATDGTAVGTVEIGTTGYVATKFE